MAKNKISEYSATASNNTDIGGINIAEGCAPSGINNAIRELMAQLKDQQAGTDGDGFAVTGAFTSSGGAVFSSTVTAPTPTAGDSSTKVATTAFVAAALGAAYPVGSIYINASVSTNPATLLGFGTWTAFGAGRVMVGLNGSDSSFDTLEETGGSKDSIVVSHTHSATASSHDHSFTVIATAGADAGSGALVGGTSNAGNDGSYSGTTGGTAPSVTVSSAGSSGTNANLQPYIVVYMWKRTA
jgi:hypothetical protein